MYEAKSGTLVNENFSFTWCDYQNHLSGVVRQLFREDCMVDVTLSTEGERIHAHRIVLSSCSTLFKELLNQVTDDRPTIILSGVSPEAVKALVEFMYRGEIQTTEGNIKKFLEAARFLQITGLMEYDVDSNLKEECINGESSEELQKLNEIEEEALNVFDHVYDDTNEQSERSVTEESQGGKKRKRRFSMKKEYNEDMLTSAINDLREGQTLIEAANRNNIPRSTLYMRAKALGIQLNASRNEYPTEFMKSAIEAVIEGSSLQQASERYGIPKTVLWRRMQKEGYQIFRSEMRKTYNADKREAAIKALERGEKLTKVSVEYQIPKTTLFRDKARLVNQGKLPTSFLKKRNTEDDAVKKYRLEEAVAACKSGTMSQAAASLYFRIPKTTIWRRLQENSPKDKKKTKTSSSVSSIPVDKISTNENTKYTFCEIAPEIPITYIDENSISEEPVIILTSEEVEELDLQEHTQIIVNSDTNSEFITNSSTTEHNVTYSSANS